MHIKHPNMAENIKLKLKNKELSLGSWMQLPDANVAEIMGQSGYDWVAVDLEHGSFGVEKLPDMLRALKLGGTSPFVRLAHNNKTDIKKALDAGAEGIIIPMVSSYDDVANLVKWAKYPPDGIRGVGYSRANLFGRKFDQYVKNINENLVVVIQIEHINAINELSRILEDFSIEAVMIGPYDLSASMGLTGEFTHLDFEEAINRVKVLTNKFNIASGIHVVKPDKNELLSRVDEGYTFIAYATDAIFLYNSCKNPLL